MKHPLSIPLEVSLTPDEEAWVIRDLALAYRQAEGWLSRPEFLRIQEKVGRTLSARIPDPSLPQQK